MTRRFAVVAGLGAAAIIGSLVVVKNVERFADRVSGPPLPTASDRAMRLHRSSLVADLHADSLLWGRDLARRSSVGHVDLPRLREGNVAIQVFTIVTRFPASASIDGTDPRAPDLITLLAVTGGWPWRTFDSLTERMLHEAARLDRLAQEDDRLTVLRTRDDLDRLLDRRSDDPRWTGAVLGIEGAHALDRPSALDEGFAAGVRLIGLAHFFDNDFAGSAHGIEKAGLTTRGRDLVTEMERRGMVVDLAHSSEATIRDVLSMARRPPIVSHTGVKATCDNERNLSDGQLRAVAAAGGVIGIGYWPTAVCGDTPAAIARAIRHAVDVVGDDHVALGSDFDGAVPVPFDTSRLEALTQAMLDVGLSEGTAQRILGANALRILREVLP
jgi:microsomal dipeptidase-like Zn-dependent dipeptidase